MKASEAFKLSSGTKLRMKNGGYQVTVERVLLEPTEEEPKGNFPLIVTKEKGTITYLLLRFPE